MNEQQENLKLVLLHHTGIVNPHYDLMFETASNSPLTTFRFSTLPSARRLHVEKLPDHRRAYLNYEGPICGNCGEVTRVTSCRVAVAWTRDSANLDITGVLIVEAYFLTVIDPRAPFDRYLRIVRFETGEWEAWTEPY